MARIFALPDVGEGLTEAEILSWHVAPGDTVTVNQVIVEIETAKAAVELPSPYAGVVSELFVEAGATVAVGTPIIAIDTGTVRLVRSTPGRDDALGTRVGGCDRRGGPQRADHDPGRLRPAHRNRGPPAAQGRAGSHCGRSTHGAAPLAKPPVRKLAKELGVDLRTVLDPQPAG